MTPEAVEEEMRSARGYGDLKAATAQAWSRCSRPCASATPSCAATRQRLEAILADGRRRRRRAMARETLADVREAMGFGPRG